MKRFVIFLLLMFTGVSIFAQIDLQRVAMVNLTRPEPITVRQLRLECEKLAWRELAGRLGRIPTSAQVTQEVQGFNIDMRRQVLDAMINERLALQAAERDRITLTENELNQHINELRNQVAQMYGRQPTEAEFAQAIREETGMELPAFREDMRRQMLTQKYLMITKEALFDSLQPPTDTEIAAEFNINRAQFTQADTIRFHMIQVPYGPDAASRTRARTLAQQLVTEIGTDPVRFDSVVARANAEARTNPNPSFTAGDAGYLNLNAQTRQVAGNDFISVAFDPNLRQGQVSRLIEGVQGYQIIKITENHPMRNLGLDDVIYDRAIIEQTGGALITVRQYIGQSMFVQRQQELLSRATRELVLELRAGNSFEIIEANLTNW